MHSGFSHNYAERYIKRLTPCSETVSHFAQRIATASEKTSAQEPRQCPWCRQNIVITSYANHNPVGTSDVNKVPISIPGVSKNPVTILM